MIPHQYLSPLLVLLLQIFSANGASFFYFYQKNPGNLENPVQFSHGIDDGQQVAESISNPSAIFPSHTIQSVPAVAISQVKPPKISQSTFFNSAFPNFGQTSFSQVNAFPPIATQKPATLYSYNYGLDNNAHTHHNSLVTAYPAVDRLSFPPPPKVPTPPSTFQVHYNPLSSSGVGGFSYEIKRNGDQGTAASVQVAVNIGAPKNVAYAYNFTSDPILDKATNDLQGSHSTTVLVKSTTALPLITNDQENSTDSDEGATIADQSTTERTLVSSESFVSEAAVELNGVAPAHAITHANNDTETQGPDSLNDFDLDLLEPNSNSSSGNAQDTALYDEDIAERRFIPIEINNEISGETLNQTGGSVPVNETVKATTYKPTTGITAEIVRHLVTFSTTSTTPEPETEVVTEAMTTFEISSSTASTTPSTTTTATTPSTTTTTTTTPAPTSEPVTETLPPITATEQSITTLQAETTQRPSTTDRTTESANAQPKFTPLFTLSFRSSTEPPTTSSEKIIEAIDDAASGAVRVDNNRNPSEVDYSIDYYDDKPVAPREASPPSLENELETIEKSASGSSSNATGLTQPPFNKLPLQAPGVDEEQDYYSEEEDDGIPDALRHLHDEDYYADNGEEELPSEKTTAAIKATTTTTEPTTTTTTTEPTTTTTTTEPTTTTTTTTEPTTTTTEPTTTTTTTEPSTTRRPRTGKRRRTSTTTTTTTTTEVPSYEEDYYSEEEFKEAPEPTPEPTSTSTTTTTTTTVPTTTTTTTTTTAPTTTTTTTTPASKPAEIKITTYRPKLNLSTILTNLNEASQPSQTESEVKLQTLQEVPSAPEESPQNAKESSDVVSQNLDEDYEESKIKVEEHYEPNFAGDDQYVDDYSSEVQETSSTSTTTTTTTTTPAPTTTTTTTTTTEPPTSQPVTSSIRVTSTFSRRVSGNNGRNNRTRQRIAFTREALSGGHV